MPTFVLEIYMLKIQRIDMGFIKKYVQVKF